MTNDNYYNADIYKHLDPILSNLNVFKPDYQFSHQQQKFNSNNIEEYIQLKSTLPFFKGGPTNYKLFSRHLTPKTPPLTKGEKLLSMRFIIQNYNHNKKEMKANKQDIFSIPKPFTYRMFSTKHLNKRNNISSMKIPKSASMSHLNKHKKKYLKSNDMFIGVNDLNEKKLCAKDLIIADYDILKYKKSFMFGVYKKKYDFFKDEDKGKEGRNEEMRKTMKYYDKNRKKMFEEEIGVEMMRKDMQERRFGAIKRKAGVENKQMLDMYNMIIGKDECKTPFTVD